jgi:hypothetical protein
MRVTWAGFVWSKLCETDVIGWKVLRSLLRRRGPLELDMALGLLGNANFERDDPYIEM